MTVAAGLYGLTLEKMMIDTLGESIEAEDIICGLVTDTHTPDFTLDDFVADIDNEMATTNYEREPGTSTEVTLSGGTLTYDHIDIVYDNGGADDVTVTNAMGQFEATTVATDSDHQLLLMLDFITAASSTESTFTTQIHTSGLFTLDYTP